MTKFTTLNEGGSRKIKHTLFEFFVNSENPNNRVIQKARLSPFAYDEVKFLGHDGLDGDVFMAKMDNQPTLFTIYFGVKGDEFND